MVAPGGWRDGFRHEVAGLLMGPEQRLDPLAQLNIPSACFIQVTRALFGRQLKRCLKDQFIRRREDCS